MGFYLKLNCYGQRDWEWLLKCISRKIRISIGGRLVLIESVLQGIPVYWMSLFPLPAVILSKIKPFLFLFLWSGCSMSRKFHLVSWEKLSVPRNLGGWGVKHLGHFNSALCAKMLWRCLFSKCLRGKIIKVKCFKGLDPIHRIREGMGSKNGGSTIWNSMVKIFPIIANDLSW